VASTTNDNEGTASPSRHHQRCQGESRVSGLVQKSQCREEMQQRVRRPVAGGLRFGVLKPGQGALFHRKDQPRRLGSTRNEAFMAALLEGMAPPESRIFM